MLYSEFMLNNAINKIDGILNTAPSSGNINATNNINSNPWALQRLVQVDAKDVLEEHAMLLNRQRILGLDKDPWALDVPANKQTKVHLQRRMSLELC